MSVHTYLKRRAKGYEQDGDLRPACSQKIAAMQRARARARTRQAGMLDVRVHVTCTTSEGRLRWLIITHGQQAAALPYLNGIQY